LSFSPTSTNVGSDFGKCCLTCTALSEPLTQIVAFVSCDGLGVEDVDEPDEPLAVTPLTPPDALTPAGSPSCDADDPSASFTSWTKGS